MGGSDEYFHNCGGDTNTGFLQAVNNDVLTRNPDCTRRVQEETVLCIL